MYASVTPTITAGAYSANDQVGGLQTINFGSAVRRVQSLTVIDKSKQGVALEVFLFLKQPTVASSDNDAADVSDTELADKCFGVISVAGSDYKDLANGSVATVQVDIAGQSHEGKIYAVVMTTATPTYGGTSDLVFKYGAI